MEPYRVNAIRPEQARAGTWLPALLFGDAIVGLWTVCGPCGVLDALHEHEGGWLKLGAIFLQAPGTLVMLALLFATARARRAAGDRGRFAITGAACLLVALQGWLWLLLHALPDGGC